MRTKEEMYDYCVRYGLNGIPYLAFPMQWYAKQHFGVIANQLLDNEEVIFCFMALADVDDFDNHGSNGGNPNSYSQMSEQDMENGSSRSRQRWVAFALTNRSHLYYAIWKPLSSDSGDVIISEREMNVNINKNMWFYHSTMDINTLRKSLPNLRQTRANVDKIKKLLYGTVAALNSHSEGEDGRRVYDQSVSVPDDYGGGI